MNEIFILVTIIVLTVINSLACIKTVFLMIFINKKLMQQAMINDTMQDVIASMNSEVIKLRHEINDIKL